jgi:hypothetical protein
VSKISRAGAETTANHSCGDAGLRDEREDAAPLGAERNGRALREAAVGDPACGADRGRRDNLRGDHRRDRRGEPMRSGDGDCGEAEGHRDEQEEGAHVVAAAQHDRDPADVLGALRERDEGADEERRRQPVLVQERVRKRREPEQQSRREHAADELERDRARKEAAQPAPVLAGHIAEAELDERFLDGEVEQALEERRRGQDERVAPERLGRENVECDDGRAEPERR